MPEVVSLLPRLQERQDCWRQIEMNLALLDILIEAIRSMRAIGASGDDVLRVLYRAIREMESV
jgi:hypothetical protein